MLRALGLVEIEGRGPIGSRAQRVLLAALLLDRGDVVSAERLAELVWGHDQPANPTASLQNHVSRLRRRLPDKASVVAVGSGYRLESDEVEVDLWLFEHAFTRACNTAPAERLELVDTAIDLWRGPPFEELDDPRAAAKAVRLEELLESLRELRSESLLALGRTHEAIADLESQRHRDPLRERTVELLMRAHLDAGRRTDALDVYQSLRGSLAEQLGLDPSPELRALESAILTEGVAAEPRPTPRASAPSTLGPVALPASSFLGRGHDLTVVGRLLDEHRIVTLSGPGGVGKTRLSLHTAAASVGRFDDVTVVELASLRDATQLAEVVAGALDLRPRTDVSAVRRVIEALGSRRHLLVLDNCEHVIGAAATFVDEAVRGTPALTLLATSREPLNVDAEHVLRIDPLAAEAEAVDLFADRAAAARPDFVIEAGNRARVERICRSLDGLPLAIELAAARLATMTLEEIEDGLGERFSVFNRGRRTADERHRSLRALVEWSVRSLDDDLRWVFARTSAFAATFGPGSAAEVCAIPEPSIADHLSDLVERSLLVEHRSPDEPHRYSFLETVRAYARELLAAEPDRAEVVGRHASWVLALVEEMRSKLAGPHELAAVDQVIASLPELRVAHQHFLSTGDGDRSLRMATALHFVALFRMHAEMFAWIIEVAERFGELDHPDAEHILASASSGSWQSGDLDGARRLAEWAGVVGARSTWPGAGQGAAESMGDVTRFLGDTEGAALLFDRAVTCAREEGDQLRIVSNLADLAMLVGYTGQVDRVRDLIGEARSLVGDDPTALRAWVDYAEGEALAEAEPPAAIDALDRAIEAAEGSGARFIAGVAGLTRAALQVRSGDAHSAIPGLVALIEEWRRSGAHVQQWITLRTVIDALVRLGQLSDAAVILGAVLASDSTTEASAGDAARLRDAKSRIEHALRDAPSLLARGADLETEAIVDLAIDRLRTLAEAPDPG